MEFSISDDGLLSEKKLSIEDLTNVVKKKHDNDFEKSLPDSVIIHYTGGSSAESSAAWLARKDVKASAHLVIGQDGSVYQLVPFTKKSWHAGTSQYAGRYGYNDFSIGIELDNPGALIQSGPTFQSTFGRKYPSSDVVRAQHKHENHPKYWHTFPEVQIETCIDIIQAIVKKFVIKEVLGHDDIAPQRKIDPGPAFPMTYVQKQVFGDNRKDQEQEFTAFSGKVDASKLNIREGAGTKFGRVAKPLQNEQKVKVIEESNGWYKVETSIEGWVDKTYIKK